eukprot:gene676-biopygen6045
MLGSNTGKRKEVHAYSALEQRRRQPLSALEASATEAPRKEGGPPKHSIITQHQSIITPSSPIIGARPPFGRALREARNPIAASARVGGGWMPRPRLGLAFQQPVWRHSWRQLCRCGQRADAALAIEVEAGFSLTGLAAQFAATVPLAAQSGQSGATAARRQNLAARRHGGTAARRHSLAVRRHNGGTAAQLGGTVAQFGGMAAKPSGLCSDYRNDCLSVISITEHSPRAFTLPPAEEMLIPCRPSFLPISSFSQFQSVPVPARHSVRNWHGGTVAVQIGGMAAQLGGTAAQLKQSAGTTWRHGGTTGRNCATGGTDWRHGGTAAMGALNVSPVPAPSPSDNRR